MRLCGGDEPRRFGFLHGNRLFDKDMETALQRAQGQRHMRIVRGGNDDGIHFSGFEKSLAVGKQFRPALLLTLQRLRIDIAKSREFAVFQLADASDVSASHHTDADNSDSDHRHFLFLHFRFCLFQAICYIIL